MWYHCPIFNVTLSPLYSERGHQWEREDSPVWGPPLHSGADEGGHWGVGGHFCPSCGPKLHPRDHHCLRQLPRQALHTQRFVLLSKYWKSNIYSWHHNMFKFNLWWRPFLAVKKLIHVSLSSYTTLSFVWSNIYTCTLAINIQEQPLLIDVFW